VSEAIFLDRDGVINRKAAEGSYVRTWQEFEFLPGAIEALRRLTGPGRPSLIVVTNQRGIARGLVTRAAVDDIHQRMATELRAAGAVIARILVCPHEKGMCACRKPGIGMFLEAQREDPLLVLEESAVVGDSLADLEAGNRLGARTFLVASDGGTTAAAARTRGLTVHGQAASLLELVEAGVFEDGVEDVVVAGVPG